MEATRQEKLKTLIEQTLILPPEQRTAFLDDACADDTALRDELDLLLAHSEETFFESLAGAVLPPAQQQAPAPTNTSDDPHRLIGRMVSHYQILEKLGVGGMGVVYKAQDTKLDRTVALKFLSLYLSTHQEAKQRFIHEAKAASSLDHPNIGTIHEIDETDDGRLFMAMTFYAGETLKAKIARGPLPVEEVLDYA